MEMMPGMGELLIKRREVVRDEGKWRSSDIMLTSCTPLSSCGRSERDGNIGNRRAILLGERYSRARLSTGSLKFLRSTGGDFWAVSGGAVLDGLNT